MKPTDDDHETYDDYLMRQDDYNREAEIEQLKAEIYQLKAERDGECVWSQAEDMKEHYCFDTQCNKSFGRDWVDPGPMEEFTYCPYCGLKIKNK